MKLCIQPVLTEHQQLCAKHWAKCWGVMGDRQALALRSFPSSYNQTYSKMAREGQQWAAKGNTSKMEFNHKNFMRGLC